ncbi:MAG: choice-of-anchor J domain-containing protein [Flavobacteriia bacterium]|nr:choice-of-anchor J domain-containing protein [Flavobacteriia bacterium]
MQKIFFLFSIISIPFFGHNQTDIFLEDFQNGIPNNWSIVDNDGQTPYYTEYNNAWITTVDPENINDTVASSTSYFVPSGIADRWLITPSINLGTFGNFVSWNVKSQDASFPDSYVVLISTTDAQLSSFTDTIALIQEENFEWTTRTVDLSENGFDNQTIYIAFINNTNDGYKLYMDSIHVWKNDPVSIMEIQTNNFSISPNPTSDNIHIQSNTKVEKIVIFNEIGAVILTSTSKDVNVSNLNNGVYFLELQSNGITSIQKFIKN